MKKKINRALSFFLTIVMLFTTICFFPFDFGAIKAEAAVSGIKIVVPETLYLTPSTDASSSIQYYINNNADGSVKTSQDTSAQVHIAYPGAKLTSVSAKTSAAITLPSSITNLVGTTFGSSATTVTGTFSLPAGLNAGGTALVEWTFVFDVNGKTQTHYAYSVAYAPYYQPVGAAAEAWSNQGVSGSYKAWLGSILWVEGVHSASASNYSGASAWYPRTDNFLPMVGAYYSSGFNNTRPSGGWIQSGSNGLFASVTYLESDGSNHRRVNVVSPLAHITVDTSRYNNFSQIPNFKIGYMITDSENTDNGKYYVADYTGYDYENEDGDGKDLGSYGNGGSEKDRREAYYNAPHGTEIVSGSEQSCTVKYRGVWNSAISTGSLMLKAAAGANETTGTTKRSAWNNNFVNISVTGANKGTLRTNVLNGTSYAKENYTDGTWNTYYSALKTAATNLCNPTSATTDTSALTNAEANLHTTLTLNANGGTLGANVPATVDMKVGGGTSASFNNADVIGAYFANKANYTFKGWSTDKNATEAPQKVTVGFNDTVYAVFEPNKYNVVFDNKLDYTKFTINTGVLTIDERTDTGFTVTSKDATDGNTGFSYAIPVTPGKTYVFSADVAIEMVAGDTRGYDMYIHTLDANQAGETSATPDTSNGAHREGDVYISLTGQKQNNNNAYIRFTAGENTKYIKVRFDANTAGNKLTVNNIRIYEEGTVADGVSYVPPKSVTYNSTYGTLPTPTRPGYDFAGWFVGDKQINSTDKVDITDTLYVTSKWTPKKYTVTWKNYDGTVLETDYNVPAGTDPTYNGPAPTAPAATAQYTYTWDRNDGWDKTVSAVTGDVTYTAKFKETLRTYTVTWKDGNGKTIKTESLEYGATPSYTGAAPTKTATNQYTYTWDGTWSPAITKVTGDATYTAQFTGTLNKYTVTWKNYDGTVLGSETYDYNAMPSFNGTPTKPEDNQYSYAFSGWADEEGVVGLRKVTGDVTYTAQFTGTLKTYTVTWKDGNGDVIETDTGVPYGTMPTYDSPVAPTKASTAQYSYTWTGVWDKEVVAVTGNVTYTAKFAENLRTYTVTWKDGNGDVLETDKDVPYGTMPSYEGTAPTKTGNAQYSYAWTGGWDAEIAEVTGNVTYTATFTETVNEYTITFINEDNTVLQSSKVKFGETPEYKGEKPTKAATVQYSYEFKDWTPAIKAVDGDATYTATFTETVNEYTITFVNEDGTELQSGKVPYGTTPKYEGATPTKAEDVQFTYEWNGWDPAVVAVTGDATYTATFEGKTKSYTVTWLSNNVKIKEDTVLYGTMPEYEGKTPVKVEDAQYTYTFTGWSPALKEVNGNQTYNAVFEPVLRSYTITFVNEDGRELWSGKFDYDTKPVYGGNTPVKEGNAQYSYTFLGWDPEIKNVTGEATYKAKFTESTNAYTVTWKNGDEVLGTETYEYGKTPEYKGETPVKTDSTGKYTYTFAGWDPEVDEVTGDAVYTAKFTETVNKYTIKFVNEDGTVLQSEELEYGKMPKFNGENPTKTATAQYSYTFKGWDSAIALVTGDATYTATYSETVNKYTVTWKNEDGTTLETDQNVEYGTTPSYDGAQPTKAQDAQYTYEFKGWTPEIIDVEGDAVYTAEFEAVTRSYTIKFVDEDNNVLYSTAVKYGETPEYKGETLVKAATVQYSYEFDGWAPAIAEVTGEATYKVVFKETVNKYTIKFVNEDGTVLQSTDVAYGDTPAYTGEPPVKEKDAQYTYTWTGAWDKEVVAVTGEATYKATYSTTVNTYTVTWLNANGYELETDENVAYGATPVYNGETPEKAADTEFTYAFAGWSPAISTVTGNVSYTATFTETLRKYTVTWKNGDNVLETDTGVEYGTEPKYNGAQPTKASTPQYSFTFAGWDPEVSNVTGDVTYTAKFTETLRSYTVTWKNYDGKVLATDNVAYGTTPVYTGATPVKASTPEYTYAWENAWDKEVVAVTGDAEYTATFTETLRSYKVTWIVDGKEWDTADVRVGDPIPEKTVPEKEGFKGAWDSVSATMPTHDVTIKAVYINNGITVTWVIDDDTTHTTVVEASKIITPDEAWKTKESTVDTVYTFAGWYEDAEFTKVAVFPEVKVGDADRTYYAKFDTSVREYTIKFVDEDGTELQSGKVAYGETPAYTGTQPTKAATAQYTYEFSGWTPAVEAVSGDAVYTATYKATVNEYTVTFVNEDGTELQSGKVAYGETPAYAGATPTKPATAQYTYTFSGWTPAIEEVTGEATYTATYSSTVNEYTITFVNEGGAVLQSGKVAYGVTPAYTGATPTKAATAQYTYTWNGWTPAIKAVDGDATYTATYDSTVNEYTVIWTDEDGTVLETDENVPYGETPSFDGTEPSKARTAQYTYTFAGWDPAVAKDTIVTGNVTYKATYTSTVNTYTVVWKNEDGTVLETDENVAYGTTPTYDGETPTKAATDEYTYTFAESWTPAVKAVEGDAEYTAVFNATKNSYTVTFEKADGEKITYTIEYGESFTTPANSTKKADATYHYSYAWTPAVNTTVTGNATYAEVLTETEHSWSEWTTILAPTCTATGTQQRECTACHYVESKTLSTVPHTEGEAVIENNVAPTCTNKGSYDTVVYCTVCKEELSRETTTVDVVPHTEGEAVIEKNVDPDCVNDGSYDTVVYCTVCKKELSRETTTVDALGHTEGKAVIENNVDPDCENKGSYDTVVYCTVCKEELSRVKTTVDALGHTEGEAVIENNFDPDCENKGSYETVVYCTECEKELSRVKTTVDALGHTEGEAVIENNVKPDCDSEGSYETVVYCTVCEKELSRVKTTVDALGHTKGEAVKENEHIESCLKGGSYEEVFYCTVCDAEISRETIKVSGKHTPGAPVIENKVVATCIVPASHDEVIYCSVCGEEVSRNTVIGSTVDHKPAKAVKENIREATCTLSGSYDNVVRCSICYAEISRTTVNTGAKGHTIVVDKAVESTCTQTGKTVGSHCSVCNVVIVAQTTVPAKGHTIVYDRGYDPTCTRTGLTEGSHCMVCDIVVEEQEVIPALGHLDEDGDGICDIDGRDVTDMDPDYGIEVGPEGDGGNHNEHICNICGREHINFFSEIICLIYKILRIFGYKVK